MFEKPKYGNCEGNYPDFKTKVTYTNGIPITNSITPDICEGCTSSFQCEIARIFEERKKKMN